MIGTTVSHYNIIEKLGGGGMGVVYKAQDLKLERLVALKFLPAQVSTDQQDKQRFIHEAKAASALDHSNICTIYEIDETSPEPGQAGNGQLFISMAYYQGETLKKKIKDERIKTKDAIDIAIMIASGLARAHEEGIVHRDIKPANIMITDQGKVKIVDFGLAKLAGQTKLTKEGATVGTTAYMSPEQVWGKASDARTDIWSLGVVLYEMLTQQVPFQGDVDEAIVYGILKKKPIPVSRLRLDVPRKLEQIIDKCLEKDPNKRYQKVTEVLEELTAVKETQLPVGDTEKSKSRRPTIVLIMISIFILLVLTGVYIFYSGSSDHIERMVIAVLPFENLSSDPDNEHFTDGITEEIRLRLSIIRNFKVLSRTSVEQYKEEKINIREIAENLKASAVLEGSVRRSEDRVRIVTQLFETENEERLWGETYDQNIADIFDIQIDIADKIAKALKATLTLSEQERIKRISTTEPTAYDYYLKGREYYFDFSVQSNKYAIQLFNKALEIDSNYAPAYAGLSESIRESAYYKRDAHSCYDSAKTMIDKALSLDPNCSEAYCALGNLYIQFGYNGASTTKAHQALCKAIEFNPSNYRAFYLMGVLNTYTREYDEAWVYFKKAMEFHPDSKYIYSALSKFYFAVDDFNSAERFLNKALELEPDYVPVIHSLGMLNFRQKRYTQAIQYYDTILKIDPTYQWSYYWAALACKNLGKFENAIAAVEKAIQIAPAHRWHYLILGTIYVEQGKYDDAISIYEKTKSIFPNCLFTALSYSFVLSRIGKIDEARSLVEPLINNPDVECIWCDAGLIPIAKFYLAMIPADKVERLVEHEIDQISLKSGYRYCKSQPYYYLGMAFLFNLEPAFQDTNKAIKYLKKHISDTETYNVEYSLARAELRKLGVYVQ
jgi:serine/threonine protein kinase/Tfp pilus assembly protein PilF